MTYFYPGGMFSSVFPSVMESLCAIVSQAFHVLRGTGSWSKIQSIEIMVSVLVL